MSANSATGRGEHPPAASGDRPGRRRRAVNRAPPRAFVLSPRRRRLWLSQKSRKTTPALMPMRRWMRRGNLSASTRRRSKVPHDLISLARSATSGVALLGGVCNVRQLRSRGPEAQACRVDLAQAEARSRRKPCWGSPLADSSRLGRDATGLRRNRGHSRREPSRPWRRPRSCGPATSRRGTRGDAPRRSLPGVGPRGTARLGTHPRDKGTPLRGSVLSGADWGERRLRACASHARPSSSYDRAASA